MASPAEIANDMDARSAILHQAGFGDHAKAMRRAAKAIRDLQAVKADLEAAAQDEADRFEDYRMGAIH